MFYEYEFGMFLSLASFYTRSRSRYIRRVSEVSQEYILHSTATCISVNKKYLLHSVQNQLFGVKFHSTRIPLFSSSNKLSKEIIIAF